MSIASCAIRLEVGDYVVVTPAFGPAWVAEVLATLDGDRECVVRELGTLRRDTVAVAQVRRVLLGNLNAVLDGLAARDEFEIPKASRLPRQRLSVPARIRRRIRRTRGYLR